MSDLQSFLNSSQLRKHYEIIAYLAHKVNEPFTLSQLDYYLPDGSSVLRFPLEWFKYMEEGLCSNRNIEMQLPNNDGEGITVSYLEEKGPDITLICRRPEIHSLTDLQSILQTPSPSSDAEGCVALHTDQVILTEEVLKGAQKSGIAYYFADKDLRALKSGGDSRLKATQAANTEETATSVCYLPLPGTHLSYKYITNRGTVERGEYGIPRVLWVGEVVYLTISNRDPSSTEEMSVSCGGQDLEKYLRIVIKSGVLPLRLEKSTGKENPQRSVHKLIQIEAIKKGDFKLFFTIKGEEHIIDMTVQEVSTAEPGVLIGRANQPENVFIPEDLFLPEPLLRPIGSSELSEKYKDVPLLDVRARLPQPWWLNGSPLAGALRERCFPPSECVAASQGRVFSQSSLKESESLKRARGFIRENQAMQQKRRRGRTAYRDDVSNRHMINLGLNIAVPFEKPDL